MFKLFIILKSDIKNLALFPQTDIFVHHQGRKNYKQKIQIQADKVYIPSLGLFNLFKVTRILKTK